MGPFLLEDLDKNHVELIDISAFFDQVGIVRRLLDNDIDNEVTDGCKRLTSLHTMKAWHLAYRFCCRFARCSIWFGQTFQEFVTR